MSLTRKMLKEMSISDENIELIISAHSETVDALKQFKADSERLKELEAEYKKKAEELENVSAKLAEGASIGEEWKSRFESLDKEFEGYRNTVEKESLIRRKKAAMTALLKECGVSERCIDPIIRVTDLDALELSEEGKPISPEEAKSEIMEAWGAFVPKTYTVGAVVADPPKESGGKIFTREDLLRMSPREINDNYEKIINDLSGRN